MPAPRRPAQRAVEILALILFPALFYGAWEYYHAGRRHRPYFEALREDGPVEWATVAALLLAAAVALVAGWRRPRGGGVHRVFLLALGAVCLVGALEEMSWGQRLLGVETPAFFEEHSDQREINAHNVLQKWLDFKTKHAAALALGLYGVLLPLLALAPGVRRLCDRVGLVVPPLALLPGFLLGSLLMRDRPTGQEEELGELFFALGLALLALYSAAGPHRRAPPPRGDLR
jgi:hypothetical protein